MAIDFQVPAIRGTYSTRDAHPDWAAAMLRLVDPRGRRVVDIGCGGGIYMAAWSGLGAAAVTGVDFSPVMLRDAAERRAGCPMSLSVKATRSRPACPTGVPTSCSSGP